MTHTSSAKLTRRTLHFTTLAEIRQEAERLAVEPDVVMLGKWSLGQLFVHLGKAMHGSIDGLPFRVPLHLRLLGPLIKGWILRGTMTAGFKLPADAEAIAYPDATTAAEGLAYLQAAIARIEQTPMTAVHPLFGRMTHDDWLRLHLRHAELHLSFAMPPARG